MRKVKLLFLLAVPLTFYIGCVKGSQTDGPQGPAGTAGPKGSPPVYFGNTIALNASTLKGIAPNQVTYYKFQGNPSSTYMLSAYIASVNAPKIWYKLPQFNVVSPNDEVFATLGYDTVKIWYYSSSAWADSSFNCNIIVVPVSQ